MVYERYPEGAVRAPNLQLFHRLPLLLALILPVFAAAPLLYPGYVQTHAGFVAVWNVADLRHSLGQWPWLPHIAISFDPLRSDGLLPYYLAALLPLAPAVAVKLALGLAWLLGSVGMFLWLRDWLDQPGALIAGLVYTYLPYRIAAVYVRGAWGEALFWGLLPWALWATIAFVPQLAPFRVRQPAIRSFAQSPLVFPAAIGLWALLGLSHLGLTAWALGLVLVFALALYPGRALLPGLAALSGTAAAAALTLSQARPVAPVAAPAGHLLYPFQLFSAYWGFGPSRPGWNDGLSLQIGFAALGLAALSVTLWSRRQTVAWQTGRLDRRLLFFLAAPLFLSLLQLTLAGPLWRLPFGPAYTLAYPWQLLGLVGLCLAVLAGATLWLDEQLAQPVLFSAIVLLVVLSSYSYLEPQFLRDDRVTAAGPQAVLGDNQVALLDHTFAVVVDGNTAGLAAQEQTAIPLTVYGLPQSDNALLLKVIWQPLQAFDQDLKVFVHLVDGRTNVLAQFDGQPRAGEYPTSRWTPGELIEDAYTLVLPAELPPGPYQVFFGMYDETKMTRLAAPGDAEGRIILDVR